MSMIALYTGAFGVRAFQSALDVTSHNLANVNTSGYKARRPAFDDLIRSRLNTNVEGNHLTGHGVKQEYVDNLMDQAGFDITNESLDFAISGSGFFSVEYRGQRMYTRNGAFDWSVEGNGSTATLVTNDGGYVLDRNGAHITVPVVNGTVNTEGLRERLGIYRFANPYGLTPENNARFTQSDNSGAATLVQTLGGTGPDGSDVIQGALEFSSVDLSKEMIDVISAQRAFQANARVVTTADEMATEINGLR